LKAGRNLITWEVSALTYGTRERRDPVYISDIEIQGINSIDRQTDSQPAI